MFTYHARGLTMENGVLANLATRVTAVTDLFAWPLKTSHYLELVNPLWSTHALQARVEGVWDETRDARTLTLRPGRNWRGHRAGQHARIGVAIDGRHYARTYSISSAPEREDGCITITVKALEGGRVSRHLVRQVRVGDYLPLALPQGDFHLPDAQPVKPLFITAGSGVTPVMSMLRSLVARERLPDAVHVHYAPHAYDVIFGAELRELAAKHPCYRLHLVYTRELGEARSAERHFSVAQLAALAPDWRARDVYACGPQALLDAVEGHWAAAGLARHLHTERFRAPLARLGEVEGGTVRFTAAGVTARADGATPLLRVAEDAGLNPRHGCRMGICHTCPRTLVSGAVRDLRTGAVHGEAGEKVLICVSAAAGDCEIEI
jgi:stearoyl-CoA 9-desaturase NADPH oxidoreductase